MCGIGTSLSNATQSCANGVSSVFSTIGSYSKPYHKTITVAAIGTGLYLRSFTATYGPALMAEWCIQATIRAIGNVTIGKALGIAVVAPAVVPQLMPFVSFGVGLVGAYFIMVILNVIAKKIFGIKPLEEDLQKLIDQNRRQEQSSVV